MAFYLPYTLRLNAKKMRGGGEEIGTLVIIEEDFKRLWHIA